MTHITSWKNSARWVAVLCWVAVLLDGFDAVVVGATMPALLEDPELAMAPAASTFVATIGLVGMMAGALAMGWATDRFGRRRMLLGAVLVFSAFTLAAALSASVWTFGLWRFAAGLGLGGCLPTAISMVTEFARPGRGAKATTVMMTGYHVGAVLTAALAIVVLANSSWHTMYVLGALPALVLLPLMWLFLPESPDYLVARGRLEEARRIARQYDLDLVEEPETVGRSRFSTVLMRPYGRNSVAVWIASFMGLLLVYGLNTWLPQIMKATGYSLGSSLSMLLVLNVGAVAGLFVAGRVGDRMTPRRAAILWFLGPAVLLAARVVRLPTPGMFAMLFLTGVFVFSSQNLVYAFVAANYPASVRATALGLSAGLGRAGAITGPLLGGALVSTGLVHPWGFYAFAIVGALGAGAMGTSATLDAEDVLRTRPNPKIRPRPSREVRAEDPGDRSGTGVATRR